MLGRHSAIVAVAGLFKKGSSVFPGQRHLSAVWRVVETDEGCLKGRFI